GEAERNNETSRAPTSAPTVVPLQILSCTPAATQEICIYTAIDRYKKKATRRLPLMSYFKTEF
ncbi:MAG: hypothetical protein OCD03_10220, partial [Hyphomicrobiales bacterium]